MDTRKKIYIYRFNTVESNHRDGPMGHKNYKTTIEKIENQIRLIFACIVTYY